MKDVQWSFGRPQENPAQQSPFFCLVFDTNSPTRILAAPELRDWLISLAAFARRAADRQVGVVFVIS